MRYYILSALLAILTGLLCVTICHPLTSKEIWKENCVATSQSVYDRSVRWGLSTKLVEGYTEDGIRHRWVEYWNTKYKKWCVWDNAISYIGKSTDTAEQLGYTELMVVKQKV